MQFIPSAGGLNHEKLNLVLVGQIDEVIDWGREIGQAIKLGQVVVQDVK